MWGVLSSYHCSTMLRINCKNTYFLSFTEARWKQIVHSDSHRSHVDAIMGCFMMIASCLSYYGPHWQIWGQCMFSEDIRELLFITYTKLSSKISENTESSSRWEFKCYNMEGLKTYCMGVFPLLPGEEGGEGKVVHSRRGRVALRGG